MYKKKSLVDGLFTSDELQRYSKKFLCGLYRMSHGNISNSENSTEIYFKNVRPEAYERPSLGFEAARQIVLHLLQEGFITQDAPFYVRLTESGLEKCKKNCY
jgi:hypothetical protein